MKIKNEAGWKATLEANDNGRIDTYGGSCLYFAEHWADAMEAEMAKGVKLEDCADMLSHEVDRAMGQYGITGFQYGAVVSILAKVWEHGEELRRWHNIAIQIGNEGEKANESGGVLNPALINVSSKEESK